MATKPADNVEQIKQWGIKAISSRVIDEITKEAVQLEASTGQKITNGQMIERLWEHYKNGGTFQATQVNPVDDLVKLVQAGGPWGEHNKLPAQVRSLMNGHARMVQLAHHTPRTLARELKQIAQEASETGEGE